MKRNSPKDAAAYLLPRLGAAPTMKLHRLIFIADALSEADDELFGVTTQLGGAPGYAELFDTHKGQFVITAPYTFGDGDAKNLSKKAKRALKYALALYGKKSGAELTNITANWYGPTALVDRTVIYDLRDFRDESFIEKYLLDYIAELRFKPADKLTFFDKRVGADKLRWSCEKKLFCAIDNLVNSKTARFIAEIMPFGTSMGQYLILDSINDLVEAGGILIISLDMTVQSIDRELVIDGTRRTTFDTTPVRIRIRALTDEGRTALETAGRANTKRVRKVDEALMNDARYSYPVDPVSHKCVREAVPWAL